MTELVEGTLPDKVFQAPAGYQRVTNLPYAAELVLYFVLDSVLFEPEGVDSIRTRRSASGNEACQSAHCQ